MIPALVVIVIVSCSRGGSGDCGGSCAVSCCGGCVAWWSRSHGLMVAVAGGGGRGCGRVTEVAAVMLCCVAVAAWCGMVVVVAWLDGGCGSGGGSGGSCITEAAAVVSHCVVVAVWRGVAVTVTWLDGGCGRWWRQWLCCVVVAAWHGGSRWSHGLVVAAVAAVASRWRVWRWG